MHYNWSYFVFYKFVYRTKIFSIIFSILFSIKKIFAVVLACCIACTCLVIPASASTKNLPSNWSHFISDLSDDFNAYRSGNITLTDFFDLYAKDCLKWGYNNVSDVTHFKDVLKGLENLGVDVPRAWKQYFYEYNDIEKDDSILNGYGAVCIQKIHSRSDDVVQNTHIYYGNYGIIKDGVFANIYAPKIICKYTDNSHNADTITYEYKDVTSIGGAFMNDTYNYAETLFYGDWRYDDGSNFDGTSEFPDKQIPNYDDDSIPENELIDFFDKLLEDLKLQFPDLSNLEGLLNAILAKLGTLDSDNDNELLEYILVAIKELKNNGETADNSELLKILEELKNALIIKDGDKVTTTAQLLEMLVQNQIRRSDITIDSSAYNQRYALIEAKILGKFSFISEIKNFVQYAIDSYSKTENSPTIKIDLFNYQHTIDFSAFDSSINLVRWIVAAFVYLSYAFATFRKIPSYINGGDNQ